MKIITINLPEKYLIAIQILNDQGIYPSRSEAIRVALRDFLNAELKMDQDLENIEELIFKPRYGIETEEQNCKEIKSKTPIIIEDTEIVKQDQESKFLINDYEHTSKPKKLYTLFPRDIYLNLIISYLKEATTPLTTKDMALKLGISVPYTSILLRDLIKKKPELLIIDKEQYSRKFSLNEDIFEQMLIEVHLN